MGAAPPCGPAHLEGAGAPPDAGRGLQAATRTGRPFAGSRMLRDMLKAEGREVGRRHVATLMKKMGVEAIYRRPNTSKPAPGHKSTPICSATWR